MLDDVHLLNRYASLGDEDAFSMLVARYVNLVYSASRRQSGGDAQAAEEIAQLVFIDLARKAATLALAVGKGKPLAGWLFASAHFASKNFRRSENRRQRREHLAYAMNTDDPSQRSAPETEWLDLRPLLDEAMSQLSPVDRDAVLLRFFEKKDLRSVGAAMGFTEEAARKRVGRALEKLRGILEERGICTSITALSATLCAQAVEIAPVGLATKLAKVSLTSATTTALGSIVSVLFLMSAKTKIVIGLAAFLCFGSIAYRLNQFKPTSYAKPALGPLVKGSAPNVVYPDKKSAVSRDAANKKGDFVATALGKIRAALTDRAKASIYPQPEMKRAIAELRERYREALPILLEALRSSDAEIRRRAIGGLAFLTVAAADAIPDLIAMLRHAPTPQDAIQIASTLQSVGVPASAIPGLVDVLAAKPEMRDLIEAHFPDFIKVASGRAVDSEKGGSLNRAISNLSEAGDDARLNGLLGIEGLGAAGFDAIERLKEFIAQPNREDLRAYAERVLKDIDSTFQRDSENPDLQQSQSDQVRLFTEKARSGQASVGEMVAALRELPAAIPVAARSLGAIGYEEMGRRFNENPQGKQDFVNAGIMLTQIAANNESQEARVAASDAFQKLQPMQQKLLYTADETAPAFAVISNALPRLSAATRVQIQSKLGNMLEEMKSIWAAQHRQGEVSDYQGSQIATFARGLGQFDQRLYDDFVAAIRKNDPRFLK